MKCDLRGAMDSQAFKQSDYRVSVTAPLFHPWPRRRTCSYFEDMEAVGERWVRDVVTGETFKVPGSMTYEQWKEQQDALHGPGTVDRERKKSYNFAADKKQLRQYQAVLGRSGNLRGMEAFQRLKYEDPEGWEDTKGFFKYKSANPESGLAFYEAEKVRRALVADGTIRARETVVAAPKGRLMTGLNKHAAEQLAARGLSEETVQSFIDDATFALKQRNGTQFSFYSKGGFAVIDQDGELKTAGRLDEGGQKLFDEVMRHVAHKK